MPYMQQPNTAGTIHGTQQYGQTSRSSSFAEVSSSSISAGAPLDAFGNIPPRQDPCIVGHTSDFIDTLARARIIAVMAMNIFVYDRPLNAHRDRWICPFSNCKQSFLDPKAMMSHAAYCTHVSASGAYCNCCGCYYDFPGQSPACLTRAGDSAPPIAKDSAMTKGKRKIHEFLNRCSGSASFSKATSSVDAEFGMDSLLASRKGSVVPDFSTTGSPSGHPPSEGAAELCADYQVVEIGSSRTLPGRSDFPSNTDSPHIPQRLTQLTVSTMSTADYVDPMISDHGDLCMSPTEYPPTDNYYSSTQGLNNGNVSYATGDRSVNPTQLSQDAGQFTCWDLDIRQAGGEGFNFGKFSMPSQESHGLMIHVPNFSRPRFPELSRQSGEPSLSGSHCLNQREDITPVVMSHSQRHDEEIVGLSHFTSSDQNLFGLPLRPLEPQQDLLVSIGTITQRCVAQIVAFSRKGNWRTGERI
ncbi:zinc c2h2-type dna-binding [Fusarium sporotrichioides]|uniref:Zinc c2h2-type dna-binding n=1 Tax=Fusarium sporotrichioides TaxID=5514 RepID=A0A395S4N9_FUSSP|nr:zinc c2h2-type dna-binding [Fusarium sporotrichioides]